MDLQTALRIVGTPVFLPGRSDLQLAEQVRNQSALRHRLAPVDRLDGGGEVRGADVLLALAAATRPLYEADVHDVHSQWGLLRYLGIFDVLWRGPNPVLGLSDAGCRVAGNQRRVLSEELGIGFSVLLAGSWLVPDAAYGELAVTAMDIDSLLGGNDPRFQLSVVGKRRPDYVLVGPRTASGANIGLLECKGTRSPAFSIKQLGSAVDQLAGLTVNSSPLPGLAFSSVVTNSGIEYNAIAREALLPRGGRGEDEIVDKGGDGSQFLAVPQTLKVEVPDFASAEEAWLSRPGEDELESLAAVAMSAAWASISELSGNDVGVGRWSTSAARFRGPELRRPREEFVTPNGATVRGVSNVVTLPGGRLEAVLGVFDYVDDALSFGDSGDVGRAQARAAAESRSSRDISDSGAEAYGRDGSALLLRPA